MRGSERRQLERFDISIPARVDVSKAAYPEALSLTTVNISAGGAFFATDTVLPVGTEVLVELTLLAELFRNVKPASPALIRLAGKVLRLEPGGMAVAFSERFHMQSMALRPA